MTDKARFESVPAVTASTPPVDAGMALPGVSFVVRVPAGAGHAAALPAMLTALRAQAGRFDAQYIFIVDSAADGARAVIRDTTRGWPGVMIVQPGGGGAAAAFNLGFSLATQPYVKLLEADDILEPEATFVLLHAALESRACTVFGQAVVDGRWFPSADAGERLRPWQRHNQPMPLVLSRSLFNASQLLLRTVAARMCGGCDDRLAQAADYSLALRLAAMGGFCEVNTPVVTLGAATLARKCNEGSSEMRDLSLATAHFIDETANLPSGLRRLAFRQAAARAWRWSRLERGEIAFNRYLWLFLLSRLPLPLDAGGLIRRTAAAFDPPGRAARWSRVQPERDATVLPAVQPPVH